MNKKQLLRIIKISFLVCFIPILLLIGVSMIVYGKNFPLVKTYYWKGFLQQRNGSLEDAIKSYDYATMLDKNYPTAYISRGSAYLDLRKYDQAIENYTIAIRLSPENEEPYAYRARAYFEIDSLEKSRKDFDKAIYLNRKFAYAYSNRALLKYTKMNDYSGGCEDLKKAAELGDNNSKDYLKQGLCDDTPANSKHKK